MNDDQLGRLYRQAIDTVPGGAGDAAQARAIGRTRRRRQRVTAAALGVIALAGGFAVIPRAFDDAGTVASPSTASPTTQPPSASTPGTAVPDQQYESTTPDQTAGPPTGSATPPVTDSHDRLVLRVGQRVSASCRVVAVPGRPVRFCAPVPEPAIGYTRGHEPAPTYCDQGVDVEGVNLSTLSNRFEKAGAVRGFASLDVVYRGHGVVSVVHQAPRRVPEQSDNPPEQVPCPAPTGGWPVGAKDENLDSTALESYTNAHPGAVVMPAFLRPSRTQVLAYVLTATDPAPVAADLRPAYGKRLCVVRSRYTKGQITRAADAFAVWTGPVYVVGGGSLGPDAQPVVDVELTAVTPDMAALADRQPDGLVRLQPWLTPVTPSR